jgi:hypothetical protein
MTKLIGRGPTILLVLLCAVIICSRLHTYREPLERDLTTYAVIAHEMLAGKALYRELWDHKPPAIHVTYAAAELIAGYGPQSIFLMNITAAIATLFACFYAGSGAGGGRIGGCFAAALWALTSGNLALEGNQPNTEVFINVCLAFAFAVFIRPGKVNLGTGRAIAIGLLFAVASLYKHIVTVHALLLVAVYLACSPADSRKKAFLECAIIGGTGFAIWGLVFAYFFLRGSGMAFFEALFRYNQYYTSHGWDLNVIHAHGCPTLHPSTFVVMLPLAVLTVCGIVHGLIWEPRRRWMLLGAYLIASGIASVMPGWFFPHYFQLWLPPLAIGAGWTLATLNRLLPLKFAWVTYAVGATGCAIVALLQIPDYAVPADEWSVRKYGPIFVATERMADRIKAMLPAGASFYEWGEESGLYFSTKRRPPSGLVFSYPMVGGMLATKLSRCLLDDLERAKPELVVVSKVTLTATLPSHPIVQWIQDNYRPFSTTPAFFLFARKQSSLDLAEAKQAEKRQMPIATIQGVD